MDLLQRYAPKSFGGLFKGRIESVDAASGGKTSNMACKVRASAVSGAQLLDGRFIFPYCDATSKAGILGIPRPGTFVYYFQTFENNTSFANIIGFISPNLDDASIDYTKQPPSTDPAFEVFGSGMDKQFNDQGLESGDWGIFGPSDKGNKVKVYYDGSLMLKSSQYNFMYMSPVDDKFYQWRQNSSERTFGSYRGEYNVMASPLSAISGVHYLIERHVCNPSMQRLAIQEERGFVDFLTTACAGDFNDVPNSEIVRSAAAMSRAADVAAALTMQGYNVYKRKVFDMGGFGLTKLPEATMPEYYCEEIKSDGSYRARIGAKLPNMVKAPFGVEVYYKSTGEWSIGSQFGKIQCVAIPSAPGYLPVPDLILSTPTGEVSVNQIIDFMKNHVHASKAGITTPADPKSPVIAATIATDTTLAATTPAPAGVAAAIELLAIPQMTASNSTIFGLNTSYIPKQSVLPDPNLVWNT